MELIKTYFPNLSDLQYEQLQQLGLLYQEWNSKINVISRKDIDHVYDHHILHSMAIAKFIHFKADANILDLGTGGGLPGLPMAILFPETNFRLIDGTRKKITVVQAIKDELGLKNIVARQIRAEEMKERFDFVICRAVASLDKLFEWSTPLLSKKEKHAFPNGLITLKGGDLEAEVEALPPGTYVDITPLNQYFKESFFEEKAIVYVQR